MQDTTADVRSAAPTVNAAHQRTPALTIEALLSRFAACGETPCLIRDNITLRYVDLLSAIDEWRRRLAVEGVGRGTLVGLKGDFTPSALAALFALLAERCIVALVPEDAPDAASYVEAAELEAVLDLSAAPARSRHGQWDVGPQPEGAPWRRTGRRAEHPLLQKLRATKHPGLVIFTSGSSGQPKAVLHDFHRFASKFSRPGKRLRTLAFLLFDHVAGQDTLLYTLAAGATLVAPSDRRPLTVCEQIDLHRVEVLPTSPSFLNLMVLSGAAAAHDLNSLKIITYGSEPMSAATLARIGDVLPHVRLIQKYGTSEFGAPRAVSKDNHSLWLNLRRDDIETRVNDGILWVRSGASMLGYLNAPSPFDQEGWICTGDAVEQRGDWLRIHGRAGDIVNVGGEKVFPNEVESAILELDWVADALVKGEPNALLGQVVVAEIASRDDIDPKRATKEVRRHCRAKLAHYKVPVKVSLARDPLVSGRQKKRRR